MRPIETLRLVVIVLLVLAGASKSALHAQPKNANAKSQLVEEPEPLLVEEAELPEADSADDRPTFTLDGRTMFFGSRRPSRDPWRVADNSDPRWKYDSDLWKRVWQDTAWSKPINLGAPINNSGGQINPTVHPRGDLVYYVGGPGGTVNQANLVDGKFTNVRGVGGQINGIYSLKTQLGAMFMDSIRRVVLHEMEPDSELHERAPDAWLLHYNENMVRKLKTWGALHFARSFVRCESSVFPDGKMVVFSENFGEDGKYGFAGKGDEDLWFVQINAQGGWDTVRPPNGKINTEFAETYPFIAADGVSLYFTSNRPCPTCPVGTSGGDDIYRTTLTANGWSEPVQLGAPFNSVRDDYGFSIGPDGETAYFVSNRSGKSRYYQVKLRDIDTLVKPKQVIVVQGRVTDSKTGAPLKAEIYVDNLGEVKEKFSVTSDSLTGNYVLALQRGNRFGLQAVAYDHLPRSERFVIPLKGTFDRTKLDFALQPVAVGSSAEFKNVYFPTGKANLLKESELELDRVVTFLTTQAGTNIEVQGHTDDVGTAAYNQKLSQDRANSVVKYLTDHGIARARLKPVGYGKTKPVSKEKTDDGRALNRRVEMLITSNVK